MMTCVYYSDRCPLHYVQNLIGCHNNDTHFYKKTLLRSLANDWAQVVDLYFLFVCNYL